uniref:Uncharacterized protein n=1 Tax=Meloidogyne enterolobii TaxID=390850 RepID=A0A6V7TSY0_MELEN|nr:unnamed protein product [Meloidogyne enterolobii]
MKYKGFWSISQKNSLLIQSKTQLQYPTFIYNIYNIYNTSTATIIYMLRTHTNIGTTYKSIDI